MKTTAILMAAAIAVAPASLSALPLPKIEEVVQPSQRELLPRITSVLGGIAPETASEDLKKFDAVLTELDEPSQLRGLIQLIRAMLLMDQQRGAEARDAIDESVRLLPGYSAPLLIAGQVYHYNDRPGEAADLLLRASRIDPHLLNDLGDYEISGLLGRLDETRNRRRSLELSRRLLEIGWAGGRSGTISTMAFDLLQARMEEGDEKGAAAMIPKIVSPSIFRKLLTQQRFLPLRDPVEAWAGPQLEKQWPIYLRQMREEWEASHDLEAGRAYAAALALAGHDRTYVETFLPLFDAPIDPVENHDLVFIAPGLAGALARLGRWDDAFAMYDRALAAWPLGSHANALNISANRARLLLMRGEFEAALAGLNASIKDAETRGGEVNFGALAAMHLYRACALEQLGRRAEDVTSSVIITQRRLSNPADYAYYHLCRDDIPAARAALLQGLQSPSGRDDVLAAMQPPDERTFDTPFSRTMNQRWAQLRSDGTLAAAARKYGRILRKPINASAPPEESPAAGSYLSRQWWIDRSNRGHSAPRLAAAIGSRRCFA